MERRCKEKQGRRQADIRKMKGEERKITDYGEMDRKRGKDDRWREDEKKNREEDGQVDRKGKKIGREDNGRQIEYG